MSGGEVMRAIVETIIDPLVLLIFAAGTFLFAWGLVVFLMNMDNPEGKRTGVRHMLWGIIGVFIMSTVLGIITIITETFGLGLPKI